MLSIYDILRTKFVDGTSYGIPVRGSPSEDHLELSVLSNMHRLFNTRQGSVRHLPDYGLPDMAAFYHDQAKSIPLLVQSILQAVRKYEPRLHRVTIEYQPGDPYSMSLAFVLKGFLANEQEVLFQTTLSSHDPAEIRMLDSLS